MRRDYYTTLPDGDPLDHPLVAYPKEDFGAACIVPPLVFPSPHLVSLREQQRACLENDAVENQFAISFLFAQTMGEDTLCFQTAFLMEGCGHAHPCLVCSKLWPPNQSYLVYHIGPLAHVGPVRYVEDAETYHVWYYPMSDAFLKDICFHKKWQQEGQCVYLLPIYSNVLYWKRYMWSMTMALWMPDPDRAEDNYLEWIPDDSTMHDLLDLMNQDKEHRGSTFSCYRNYRKKKLDGAKKRSLPFRVYNAQLSLDSRIPPAYWLWTFDAGMMETRRKRRRQ